MSILASHEAGSCSHRRLTQSTNAKRKIVPARANQSPGHADNRTTDDGTRLRPIIKVKTKREGIGFRLRARG